MLACSTQVADRVRTLASPRPRAFTLVELLVVIGIIAVLISILLPVIGRSKQQASKLKCLSNMRQIAQGAVMYSSEQKGALVPVYSVEEPGAQAVYWPILLVRAKYLPQGNKIGSATGPREFGTIFVCPDTPDLTANVWVGSGGSGTVLPYPGIGGNDGMQRYQWLEPPFGARRMWIDCSYGINGSDNRNTDPVSYMPNNAVGPDRRIPWSASRVRKAAELVLLVDGNAYNLLNNPMRIAGGRHGAKTFNINEPWTTGTVNVAFQDGHAETVDRNKLPRQWSDIGQPGYTWPKFYVNQQ